MSEITLTINGKQVKGKQGDTVLDVCQANSIDLPTLCHYKGLTDIGACRLCLVEVEKERKPVPACAYPARDGIVVTTSTEKLEKYRRLVLELLFTERNHLCAYCVATGDCELQNLAYKYQMDNARYQYSWPNQTTDSSHPDIVLDHNRCILCGRCIRTCDEITGAHALDFGKRGWKTNVCADINQPLGESSCISCGGCFQSCPTGAIFSKISAYRGKPSECTSVESTCAICGVGCNINGLVKNNRLVRIDSPDMTKPRGLLCEIGRFEPLYEAADRITTPLKRNNKGQLVSCSYEEAFEAMSKKLGASVAGLASGKANSEALKAFADLMDKLGSKMVDTLDGDDCRTVSQGMVKFDSKAGLDMEAKLEDILAADCIVVIGAHPTRTHPVIGSYVMRAALKNNAQLVVIDPLRNPFTFRAAVWLKPPEGKKEIVIKALGRSVLDHLPAGSKGSKEKYAASFKETDVKMASNDLGIDMHDMVKAGGILAGSKNGVIIYGNGILQYKDAALVATILNLAALTGEKPRVISLKRYSNSRGAWDLGLANASGSVTADIAKGKARGLYLLLADDLADSQALADSMKGVEFAVVQASYRSPITEKADVVLPSLLWTESKGSYTTIDGISKKTAPMVKANEGIKTDADTLKEVARHLKK